MGLGKGLPLPCPGTPLPPPPDPEMEWQETVSLWPSLVSLKGLKDGAERGDLWDTVAVTLARASMGSWGWDGYSLAYSQSFLPPSLLTQSSRDRDTAHGPVLSPWSATVRGTAR